MDWLYAYNFWRRVLVDSSGGAFTDIDFDQWFHNGSISDERPTNLVPIGGHYDRQSDFFQKNRQAFIAMLNACVDGRFGKAPNA